jgi:hypothetical protein
MFRLFGLFRMFRIGGGTTEQIQSPCSSMAASTVSFLGGETWREDEDVRASATTWYGAC